MRVLLSQVDIYRMIGGEPNSAYRARVFEGDDLGNLCESGSSSICCGRPEGGGDKVPPLVHPRRLQLRNKLPALFRSLQRGLQQLL